MWRVLSVALAALLLLACEDASEEAPDFGAGLRVNTVLGAAEGDYAVANAPRRFVFPADHGAHPRYRSEWWYVTAVLEDESGAEYGAQFTLFRQALQPQPTGEGPWHTAQAYLAHLAVTDVEAGRHEHATRFARGHPAQAGVAVEPFRAWIEDWQLAEEVSDPWTVRLVAGDDQLGTVLTFEQTQPLVLQGDAGLSHKGPGSASYYYSMPRLQTRGTLRIGAREVTVSGLAWLDREWSTSVLGEHLAGWNWFALQLDDGRSLMAFSLTRKDGKPDPFDHGLYLTSAGEQQEHLSAETYTLTPERFWRAPDGARWPVRWLLTFSEAAPKALAGQTWRIEALLDDQLMDVGLVYWEGLVGVQDASGKRLGRGYMELTGYLGDDNDR